jgi:hypothetical protein
MASDACYYVLISLLEFPGNTAQYLPTERKKGSHKLGVDA